MTRPLLVLALALLLLSPSATISQTTADADLLAEITKIKAIDNHAHPLRYVSEGEKPDDEFDVATRHYRAVNTASAHHSHQPGVYRGLEGALRVQL